MLLEFVSAPAPSIIHSACYVCPVPVSLSLFRASIPSRVYICTAPYYCLHQAVNKRHAYRTIPSSRLQNCGSPPGRPSDRTISNGTHRTISNASHDLESCDAMLTGPLVDVACGSSGLERGRRPWPRCTPARVAPRRICAGAFLGGWVGFGQRGHGDIVGRLSPGGASRFVRFSVRWQRALASLRPGFRLLPW